MKNRRFTYIYILLAALLLAASYQLNYRDSKEAVQNRINEQFRETVPHWGDSIYAIRNYPSWGRFHSKAYARKTKTTVITEGDTVVISARYFPPKEYDEYQPDRGHITFVWGTFAEEKSLNETGTARERELQIFGADGKGAFQHDAPPSLRVRERSFSV